MRARAGWWVAIVCGLIGPVVGQEPGSCPVRVSLRGGGVIEGRLECEDDEGLQLRIGGVGRMRLPRRRVLRLEQLAERRLPREPQRAELPASTPAPAEREAPTPAPARSPEDSRRARLEALAEPLEVAPTWLRGELRGEPAPEGLPFQGRVFALELVRGQTIGALLVMRGPSAPPGLDLFDLRGRRVIARQVGQGERSAEIVATVSETGRYYLFAGCPLPGADDRLPFRLLVADTIDPGAWDTRRWLRPGERVEGQFDPFTPELDGRPARFYSLRLQPGEAARISSSERVRLFTSSGIPLPDERGVYDGVYLAAVLGRAPVERGKVPFTVRSDAGR